MCNQEITQSPIQQSTHPQQSPSQCVKKKKDFKWLLLIVPVLSAGIAGEIASLAINNLIKSGGIEHGAISTFLPTLSYWGIFFIASILIGLLLSGKYSKLTFISSALLGGLISSVILLLPEILLTLLADYIYKNLLKERFIIDIRNIIIDAAEFFGYLFFSIIIYFICTAIIKKKQKKLNQQ